MDPEWGSGIGHLNKGSAASPKVCLRETLLFLLAMIVELAYGFTGLRMGTEGLGDTNRKP